ncbi:hypothetical protein BD324DRAFT_653800 [Kockovaella imperatae]|uniref:Uncharacterized protein n=1 Tax=Kockovaella imperatae TaxID=4999 RepID=A0A1Y1U8A7_9TREE|nr:hypothetical protein BD324DRAFT_653800 [Kockovaella imperatae]ORX33746.1 hypothetical protein BD324DRAFT_653800 [Kockovaella imperatae]
MSDLRNRKPAGSNANTNANANAAGSSSSSGTGTTGNLPARLHSTGAGVKGGLPPDSQFGAGPADTSIHPILYLIGFIAIGLMGYYNIWPLLKESWENGELSFNTEEIKSDFLELWGMIRARLGL